MRTVTPEQARNLFASYQCKEPSDLFGGDEEFVVNFIKSRWADEFNKRLDTVAIKCHRIMMDKIGTDWQLYADMFNANPDANHWFWEMKNPNK